MATLKMTRETLYRTLRAVAPFMSEDFTRVNLNAVQIEITAAGPHFVATDGHTLADINEIPSTVDGEASALLAAEGVKALIQLLKPSKATRGQDVVITLADGLIRVTGPDISFERKPVETAFPPWRQVVPSQREGESACGLFGVNPDYLIRVSKSAVELGRDSSKGMRFTPPPQALDPMRMDCACDAGTLTAVVMPMRI